MIACTITTEHSPDKLKRLFKAELSRTHERSSITITESDGKAAFSIEAKDTTALRAAVNTVTSVLAVYEKTLEATHGRATGPAGRD